VNDYRDALLNACDQLYAALDQLSRSRPRSFDAALVGAQAQVEDLRKHFLYGEPPSLSFILDKSVEIMEMVDRAEPRSAAALDHVHRCLDALRAIMVDVPCVPVQRAAAERASDVSRRTLHTTRLAVRLLPPADRARYREEFAAELADLPRCDQAPHAVRLVFRAWSLRRSLAGKVSIRSIRVVIAVGLGSGGATALSTLGWPTTVLGTVVIMAFMWTISSPARTRHLTSLIRAARKK
jgi:hypothetical protein